ncbi:hypothetical protein FORMB_13820 [Formosa sp. Hel1_33_131]|uniref:G-D-S-L family lipolytic protein n=1 Tax=Formosa sp. Hel1_33_131 TaxID=1336794 RepID=UPI00084E0BA3|nr:G-D-S-L family lipolytic protein [Formosa sp. Hel1_33_131]AOR28426.1 hypothetical protein FORMB_13820 [Formosa sp. Hel1_33_131]
MKHIKYLLLSTVVLGFTACNDVEDVLEANGETVETETPIALTAGDLDLSNYVAVGPSFTAGYTDGAVFKAGQENSYPNILSKEFAKAGGGAFTQPLVSDNIGGLLLGGTQIAEPRLFFNGATPERLGATPTTEAGIILTGPFNNMGVPGAKSFHLLAPGYGNLAGVPLGLANPYFARMASSPNATVLGDALAQNPSFFTLSLMGGNDVLSYALSGGTGVDQTGNPDVASYGGNDITDPAAFGQIFGLMVSQLTANGAKGVVTNVPDVTKVPFFNTVPHNPVPLDAATAGVLNSAGAYGAYNAGVAAAFGYLVSVNVVTQEDADMEIAKRTITFTEGEGNALVIMDEYLTDLTAINPALVSMRQATSEDLILLTASTLIPLGTGVAVPMGDELVLTPQEITNIQTATDAYNMSIETVRTGAGLGIVDLKMILDQATSTGWSEGDFVLTANLVTGGAISLDGIHMTARGYAALANCYLRAADATYGSNFEASGNLVNIGTYPTNYSPMLQ